MENRYEDLSLLEGLVTECIYESDSSDYKVCVVQKEDGEEATIVGSLPNLRIGEHISARGLWTQHNVYGPQLNVRFFETSLPKTKESIESYLGSGALKGIGPSLAHRIILAFGEEALDILQTEPERLAEIKGISMKMAMDIGTQYQENQMLQEVIMRLQQYGITPSLSTKLYQIYKENTVQVLQKNPYSLAEHVRGIGFKRADAIAFQVGIEPDAPERLSAALIYVLTQASEEGHTFLYADEVEERLFALTGITGLEIENLLTQLLIEGKIVQQTAGSRERLYLTSLYQAEMSAAVKITALSQQSIEAEDLESAIDEAQQKYAVVLADEQREAIRNGMQHGVVVITGGPGTGKTTIINILLDLLEADGLDYLLCAPTGRAAKRITETTGREARTIHRLLELESDLETNHQSFHRNEDNPLETDVVVVDEMSMVDIVLFDHLLKAIPEGTRLVLVGDQDQLPSVGPGNVLKDVINSGCVKVVWLKQIFRQGRESFIVTNAHRILQGEYPVYNTEGTDFFLLNPRDDVLKMLRNLVHYRLPKYMHCSAFEDLQVLTPMRIGLFGVESLNKALQEEMNPPSKTKKELEFRNTVFREGDKVMQIKNDYNLAWRVNNQYGYALEEGCGVFNGDVGRVTKIDSEKNLMVCFDDQHEVTYEYAALEELELAYAITIHKAQGSETKIVVMPLLGGSPKLFCRNLLYTGVTRARKLAVLVGSEKVIRDMIDNDRPMLRNSSLCDRIRESAGILPDMEVSI